LRCRGVIRQKGEGKKKKENHLITNRAGHYLSLYLGQEEGEGVAREGKRKEVREWKIG
jgi:hypothetical protein